ncbi:sigma-54-dependent Fis family transcriptional regulator [Ketobacter sp. MCCC 1A13808]|uniref:sigma-54-dependent transcriptional regulator n=1 Tax=Ketobacter sp. MCCC 1A13808 TaxID=2602738 RepID=UPI000F0DE594|nr:sigma-54 dependent transcriptional regulator [Ketobacter sp. MCCC 1A13808]MVF13361.1 sigma-54-dependent Fis family transcriptional regulator [Ketobacter sp. MCCC 1A13808]RLP54341.1 MAG: sigma-54-dependent Fis family transcriptional regulator [Ketobacter sp.]
MSHILIVEDEAVIRNALRRLLERSGYQISEAGAVQDALDNFKLPDFDLIITDLRLPGAPGTDIISHAEGIPVLVMTSYASLKSAVESMKMGAVDYIAKPFDHDEMLMSVERILKEKALQRENQALKSQISRDYPTTGMIGECESMQVLFKNIQKVSPTDSTVLVLGESGTGKELVARAVHDQSLRSAGPLISVNCAAIPETLIESELFGHEKGAFTGANANRKGLVEAADGGTLFLDEIGELPMEAQARLLRLLQEKEVRRVGSVQSKTVDVRLVAATHRNLKFLAKEGRFREDLYYRLHVVELKLPPLRERGADVEKLALEMLIRTARRMAKKEMSFSAEALKAINSYRWPGNVRELENAIERAVILCDGQVIAPDLMALDLHSEPEYDLDDDVPLPTPRNSLQKHEEVQDPAEDLSLEDYFQRFVLEHQDQMTETELAQKLGISRKCLWERRQRLGIPRKKAGAR